MCSHSSNSIDTLPWSKEPTQSFVAHDPTQLLVTHMSKEQVVEGSDVPGGGWGGGR